MQECSVCLESLFEPKLLPCLHSMCSHCIEDALTISKCDNCPPSCPFCREPFAADLLVHNSLGTITKGESMLDSNAENGNDPETITTIGNKACAIHTNKLVIAWCSVCSLLICDECLSYDHRKHSLMSFRQAESYCASFIKELVKNVNPRLEELANSVAFLHQLEQTLTAHTPTLTGDIQKAFSSLATGRSDLSESLDARASALIATAQTAMSADIKITQLQYEALESELSRTQLAINYAEAFPTTRIRAPKIQRLRLLSLVIKRLIDLGNSALIMEPIVQDSMTFCLPHYINLSQVQVECIGRVCHAASDFRAIAHPVFSFDGLMSSSCVCALPDSNLVFCDLSVRVCSMRGEVLHEFEQRSSRPTHVCVRVRCDVHGCPELSEIWIAYEAEDMIIRYLYETGDLIGEIFVSNPWRIAALPNGDLVVITRADGLRLMIRMSLDGEMRWCIDSACSGGITVSADGTKLIESDYVRLNVYDAESGELIREITGDLNGPGSVSATEDGHVIVTESSDCVSVWTLEGDFVHRWGSTGEEEGEFMDICGCLAVPQPEGRHMIACIDRHRCQVFYQ